MPNTAGADAPDLTACDREPITRLDRIQSFGFLLALANDWTIARASANCGEMLGTDATALIGKPLDSIISRQALHEIRNRMTILQATSGERLYNVHLLSAKRRFDLSLHYSGDLLILEGEPSSPQDQLEAASMVRAMIERLRRAKTLPEFHRDAARQVRAITRFARVMVYRFSEAGDGEVIAESTQSNVESYLGLHYPASDIPVQARALYLRNAFRIIADVNAPTVPILPARGSDGALDMTLAVTRAVSPVHVEYLVNMGVGASLSISIIVDNKLWGLIACHHPEARRPSFVMRTAAELFGQMYSMMLESRLRGDAAEGERTAREMCDRFISSLAADERMLGNAEFLRDILDGMIECDGLAVYQHGMVTLNGVTPPEIDVVAIAGYLNSESPSCVFDTDQLGTILPGPARGQTTAAGMLAIPVSRIPRDYVMLFRRELLEEVRWGGDPAKAVVADNGHRVSPRKSFKAFASLVRGKSRPFAGRDRRIGEAVRVAIIEVILRYSEAASGDRRRANERSELLIAELNHRVRNILTLIRGLISRTAKNSASVSVYVDALGGRVQALARAHDYVTRHSWGPASIVALFEDEINAHRSNGHEVFHLEGPRVMLRPIAMSTMALVIHELATNSAKHGALSTQGSVHVALEARPDGGLDIRWRERGGPPVMPPEHRGFGSAIVERTVPFDLQGTADVRYVLSGLEADFFLPAEHVIIGAPTEMAATPMGEAEAVAHGAVEHGAAPLAGKSVLLLEDNLIIALETEDMLLTLGAREVIVASTIPEAVAAAAAVPDFAVLDINVAGRVSFGFATQLRDCGVPYLFASGYGDQVPLDSKQAGVTVLQKPFELEHLREALLLQMSVKASRP